YLASGTPGGARSYRQPRTAHTDRDGPRCKPPASFATPSICKTCAPKVSHDHPTRRATSPAAEVEEGTAGPRAYLCARRATDKLYFANGSAGCSSAMRLRMMLQYSGSRSIPIHEKPSWTAARRVVPEPAKGSRTVPPGGVTRRHRYRMSFKGFTVTWLFSTFPPIVRSERDALAT